MACADENMSGTLSTPPIFCLNRVEALLNFLKWFSLFAGRGLFVAKQIVDVEVPLHQLESKWLGPEVAGLFEMGRAHFLASSGKDPTHYLER